MDASVHILKVLHIFLAHLVFCVCVCVYIMYIWREDWYSAQIKPSNYNIEDKTVHEMKSMKRRKYLLGLIIFNYLVTYLLIANNQLSSQIKNSFKCNLLFLVKYKRRSAMVPPYLIEPLYSKHYTWAFWKCFIFIFAVGIICPAMLTYYMLILMFYLTGKSVDCFYARTH